jgi:hypothetical protein
MLRASWQLTTFGPRATLLAKAPSFTEILHKVCGADPCSKVELEGLFPAGRGVWARVGASRGPRNFDLPNVFLEVRDGGVELSDALPAEIEANPAQLRVEGSLQIAPERSKIEAALDVEVLSGGQRYLLFDFFPQDEAQIGSISQNGTPLRFTHWEELLVVELAEEQRLTTLHFEYVASHSSDPGEVLLFENWVPYLGGPADWQIEVSLPRSFELALPTQQELVAIDDKDKRYRVSGSSLERLPIAGRRRFRRLDFEHDGTDFQLWLAPRSIDRSQEILQAVITSMEDLRSLGAFPATTYRIVEARYAAGDGALGLRDAMVLGPDVLRQKDLLPFIAHELAHAWFAGLVRDSRSRWSEALASYVSQWPLSEEAARRERWNWATAYEQVPAHRDLALAGDQALPSDDALRSAIFYGKGALVLADLERRHGIAKMRQVLALFVYQYRGMRVGWTELQQSVADVLGNREGYRFGQWLENAGGPELRLHVEEIDCENVRASIEQTGPFLLESPVDVALLDSSGEKLANLELNLEASATSFALPLQADGRFLAIDPEITMPRRVAEDRLTGWTVSAKRPAHCSQSPRPRANSRSR